MRLKFFIATTVPQTLNFFRGNLRFLNKTFEVCAISSEEERLNEIGEREGVRTHCISMRRPIALFRDVVCLLQFCRLFMKEKPTVVHGNTPKASLLSLLAAKITGVKVRIYMCHGLRYQGSKGVLRWVLMNMERISCACAHEVICVSNGVKDGLISDGICPASKAMVVHHGSAGGIDLKKFDPTDKEEDRLRIRKDLNINKDDFVFIFIGRVVRDKGVNELLSAFDQLDTDDRHIHLIIVGDSDDGLDPITEMSHEIVDNNERVHLVGKQMDVRPYLNASDVLVLPSYREGFGMVLIEAGAMNLPCITTDVTGCNEIIIDGENGLLVPPKDENALSGAMKHFLNNPTDVERMALNARKLITERYEQQVVWNALLKEYKRMVGERVGG